MQQTQKTTEQDSFEADLSSLCEQHGGLGHLLESSIVVQRAKSCGNADEYRLNVGGRDTLIKTYRNRPWIVRVLLGRYCLKNEFESLKLIYEGGLANVAAPYSFVDKDTIAVQYIPNAGHLGNLKHQKDCVLPVCFFRELVAMVRNMHQNGICHGDMRRANVLIGEDGKPWLVDLATSVKSEKGLNIFRRLLFYMLVKTDCYALGKIVKSCYPELLERDMRDLQSKPPWYLKLGYFYRHNIYHRFIRKRVKRRCDNAIQG